jgi:hypothetical protein
MGGQFGYVGNGGVVRHGIRVFSSCWIESPLWTAGRRCVQITHSLAAASCKNDWGLKWRPQMDWRAVSVEIQEPTRFETQKKE